MPRLRLSLDFGFVFAGEHYFIYMQHVQGAGFLRYLEMALLTTMKGSGKAQSPTDATEIGNSADAPACAGTLRHSTLGLQ